MTLVRSPTPDARAEGTVLNVDMDGLAAWTDGAVREVEAIVTAYERWIASQRRRVPDLRRDLQTVAVQHLDACEAFLADARRGWDLTRHEPLVHKLVCWTSKVMADQRRAYSARTRPLVFAPDRDGRTTVVGAEGTDPHTRADRRASKWRAFQIIFLPASVPAIVEPRDRATEPVDIIWMPTGGGKTEAYLAVAAFTMLWRRYRLVGAGQRIGGQGATVLMRYTLRLLTAQQLQRAAALVCAPERLRADHVGELGEKHRFTIGAWLGKRSTPNDWVGAVRALKDWRTDASQRAFLLARCPWCGAEMGRRSGPGVQEIDGYRLRDVPGRGQRVMAYCPDPACSFNPKQQAKRFGLPVFEVDQDLYRQPPTFVVATIDKFAQLSWRTEPASLFGLNEGVRTGPGPDLFIR